MHSAAAGTVAVAVAATARLGKYLENFYRKGGTGIRTGTGKPEKYQKNQKKKQKKTEKYQENQTECDIHKNLVTNESPNVFV